MSSQDRDLKKLKQLIKAFGLNLYFRPYTRYTDSAHYVAGTNITVFVTKRTSKTDIILSLLHEIGHHIDWITNKCDDKDTQTAYSGFDAKYFKKYAKIILNIEKSGIKNMSAIHKLLNLEIPLDIVKKQEKVDLFNYSFFYKNRRFPTGKELRLFERKIKYAKRKKF